MSHNEGAADSVPSTPVKDHIGTVENAYTSPAVDPVEGGSVATSATNSTTAASNPGEPIAILHAGWLSKQPQGSLNVLRFQKRYFILASDRLCYTAKAPTTTFTTATPCTSWLISEIHSADQEGKEYIRLGVKDSAHSEGKRSVLLKGTAESVSLWMEKLLGVGIKPSPVPEKPAEASAAGDSAANSADPEAAKEESPKKPQFNAVRGAANWLGNTLKTAIPVFGAKKEDGAAAPGTGSANPTATPAETASNTTNDPAPSDTQAETQVRVDGSIQAAESAVADPAHEQAEAHKTAEEHAHVGSVPEYPVATPVHDSHQSAQKSKSESGYQQRCGWLFSFCFSEESTA